MHCLEKRKELIENLATSFDRELLNYALLPPEDGIGYGVNVNTSMLGSAGSILISCDDDIISKPARIKPALLDALLEKMRNPLSLFGKEGCDLSIERAKYHLEHYGEVLKIWPDLWKKNLE